ncbi:hypothetical protein J6590_020903 [Homalodisca vitripennis]|nr:hypothetical protein J6590_020903 [Homalodisca vitripennis]
MWIETIIVEPLTSSSQAMAKLLSDNIIIIRAVGKFGRIFYPIMVVSCGLLPLQFVFSDCKSAYMTEAKIDEYYSTLSRNPNASYPQSQLSPQEKLMDANTKDKKVGDITYGQLMAGLCGLLDQKLSKLATKGDLGNLSRDRCKS